MSEQTYNQKYLDEKFSAVAGSITELKTLITTNNNAQVKQIQHVLDKVADLNTQDQLINKDVKDLSTRVKGIEAKVDKNNFFSIRGALFVLAIFAVMMTAFLMNGLELLKGAL